MPELGVLLIHHSAHSWLLRWRLTPRRFGLGGRWLLAARGDGGEGGFGGDDDGFGIADGGGIGGGDGSALLGKGDSERDELAEALVLLGGFAGDEGGGGEDEEREFHVSGFKLQVWEAMLGRFISGIQFQIVFCRNQTDSV